MNTPTPERVTLTAAERDSACSHFDVYGIGEGRCYREAAVEQILTARRAAWEAEVRAQVKADAVLGEVAAERARQDKKWGEQNHPNGTGPTMTSLNRVERARHDCEYAAKQGTVTYRHVLAEEYYEALAEADPAKLRAELIQVAAVAVAWVEKIDRDTARIAGGDQ